MKNIEINIEDAAEKHRNGKTLNELAKFYGCSSVTIGNKFKKNNIQINHKYGKKEIDELLVVKKYKEDISISDLAKLFTCSTKTIQTKLKKNGIIIENKHIKKIINKEELFKLYKTIKSINEISKILKCSTTLVNKKIKEFGFELNVKRVYKTPLPGEKFNMLTFKKEIKKVGEKVNWLCGCDCGKEKIILARLVYKNLTKSCGCFRGISSRKRFEEFSYKDITGGFWYILQKSAKSRNKEFKISIEDAWRIYEKQEAKCALSGLELDFKNKPNTFKPSLDRIDSNKGYLVDNIQWVCQEINMMKWKLDQERFKFLCKKISEKK